MNQYVGTMTSEDFVAQIRSAVVEQNVASYKQVFESTPPERASDPYWKRALTLYRSLDEPSRLVLLEIMRQAAVDTVSNLFGILDGSNAVDPREDYVLATATNPQKINGDLQDLFLEAEELDAGSR
jgi:hypothetical protein